MQRLLPPLLFLGLIAPMLSLTLVDLAIFRNIHKTGTPYWEIAASVVLGLTFLIGARLQFRNAGTEIMTFKKPLKLVTNGLYRVSRNPMYLGFLILLIAIALAVNLWQALIAPLIFFLVTNYWYIPVEEKAAMDVFGDSYRQYKTRVRRWI